VNDPGGEIEPRTTAQPEQQSYEIATGRVEEIIRRLDSGEASLNETLALVKEGKALIEQCAGELEDVAGALEELRLDELVARLEGERGATPTGQDSPASPASASPASSSEAGTEGSAEVPRP
jgi:exodeoxyribonuclease VII small subunit